MFPASRTSACLIRNNGTNPPTSDQFKTYAGGPLAGAWQTTNMTQRVAADSSGYTPEYMADYYYAKVTGISNAFVDYYVSATDAHGNTYKSPNPACVGRRPAPAAAAAAAAVVRRYRVPCPAGRRQSGDDPIRRHRSRAGVGQSGENPSRLEQLGHVVSPDTAMTFNSASNWWQCTMTVPYTATNLNCCFNNGSGTWDNNGGANWNFAVTANSNPQPPAQPQNLTVTPVADEPDQSLLGHHRRCERYFVNRDGSTIAPTAATSYSDTGLAANSSIAIPSLPQTASAISPPSATVCTTTPAVSHVVPPFVLDGAFDYPSYLLANSGMVLYGAVRGTTLYVATWSPGTNGPNDHFIFVTDQLLPSATAAAPWANPAATPSPSTSHFSPAKALALM